MHWLSTDDVQSRYMAFPGSNRSPSAVPVVGEASKSCSLMVGFMMLLDGGVAGHCHWGLEVHRGEAQVCLWDCSQEEPSSDSTPGFMSFSFDQSAFK
jgi:hypothetical protein